MMDGKKILVPSFDFKPMLGGVAHYAHEVLSVLHREYRCKITVLARDLPESKTYDQLSDFQIHRVKTPDTALLSLFQWTRAVIQLKKTIQPDLIFCPLWFPDATAVYLAQKKERHTVPYFIAAHAMELVDGTKNIKQLLRRQLLGSLRKQTLNSAQNIFPVSQYTKMLLEPLMPNHLNKIRVVNNGINLSSYTHQPTETERFRRSKKRLLTVTRLNPYKGVDMVIQALPSLLKRGVEIEYTVIGKGPDLPRLQKLVNELNLQKQVQFLGAVSQQEIIQSYNRADLFVLLSREELPDVEGFGLVFLEAAACGLPSLGGRSGGIPDAIDENRSGWLVSPTDLEKITESLFQRLTRPDDLKQASEYGLNMVKKRTWSNSVRIIAESMNVI